MNRTPSTTAATCPRWGAGTEPCERVAHGPRRDTERERCRCGRGGVGAQPGRCHRPRRAARVSAAEARDDRPRRRSPPRRRRARPPGTTRRRRAHAPIERRRPRRRGCRRACRPATCRAKMRAFASAYASKDAVLVEVIGREVQQHRDPRVERLLHAQLERRALDHEHLVPLAGGLGERVADVAARHRVDAVGAQARLDHRRWSSSCRSCP